MQSEYLIFNTVILLGPLLMSFEPRVRYVQRWGRVLIASLLAAVPFLIWDALVTGRHWWFNEAYTLPFRLLGLPLGEWAFFLTTSFALVFVWEILGLRFNRELKANRWVGRLLVIVFAVGSSIAFSKGLEYTGLVQLVAAMILVVDSTIGTRTIAKKRYLMFLPLLLLLILLFNSYLTGRPVVLYGSDYNLGIRLGTIPVEDFLFGISHMTLVLMIYEWVGSRYKK